MSGSQDWARRFSRISGTVDAFFEEWIQAVEEHHAYSKIANGGESDVPAEPGLYLWAANRTVDHRYQIVPRYVGRATTTLRKRIVSTTGTWGRRAGRYVLKRGVQPGECPPQGFIACKYQPEIEQLLGSVSLKEYSLKMKNGLLKPKTSVLERVFPPHLVASFKSKEPGHPGQDLRLRHAVDWAFHGGPNLAHLWVAFLPGIADLECALISAAIRWRRSLRLPPLLNDEDK